MSRRRLILVGSAALAVFATTVGSTWASPAIRATMPAKLVGAWGKTISTATWQKHGVYYESPGHWGIRISAGGVTGLLAPPGTGTVAFATMHATVSGGAVAFGPVSDGVCAHGGTYRWSATDHSLSFALVKDDCTPRAVLLTAGSFARA